MPTIQPFHIAVAVHDIDKARFFYTDILGCSEGRSTPIWIDFNLYGHQFVTHLNPTMEIKKHHTNPVDGYDVPVPHYGVVLTMDQWNILANKLKEKDVHFIIEPYVRFKGQAGEQATMFFLDPSGNALEFKAFQNINQLFAK